MNSNFANQRFLSVSAINRYITHKFAIDENLQEVYLEGEVSNFRPSGKHFYFSLKDEESEISATFFYPWNQSLKVLPRDGEKVKVKGRIQTYEKKGTYSINISYLEKSGLGALYQQFIDLKAKLEAEGLFDARHKLPIPAYPRTIGVITAEYGDAVRDIITTFNRRYPLVKLLIYPSLVQGQGAPADLIRNLQLAYQNEALDLIIIARGGGSFEDLSCFNDEVLARVVAAAPIPVVSAVGHELDYTICDFVASLRVPTPTAAAASIAPNIQELDRIISSIEQRLTSAIQSTYNNYAHVYQQKHNTLQHFNPLTVLNDYENACLKNVRLLGSYWQFKLNAVNQSLTGLQTRLANCNIIRMCEDKQMQISQQTNVLQNRFQTLLAQNNQCLANIQDKLIILNPLNLMKKGYSIIYQNGEIISTIKKVDLQKQIVIRMADGSIIAQPINKEEE